MSKAGSLPKKGWRDKLKEVWLTLCAVVPLLWGAIKRGQLFRPACTLTKAHEDILFEVDVRIPVEEGFCLTANIFRSKKAAQQGVAMPVVMCAHPYDNHLIPALGKTPLGGPPQQYRLIPQAGKPRFSELTSWESPDPNFWVPAGYAVVNLNLPGYANSEGPPSLFSEHQSKCFYEAIEWVAKQPWCTGKVGLNGVSFLAITQFHVAACQAYGGPPPALRCISPWEGMTDMQRDLLRMGGVEDNGFLAFWWNTEVKSTINGKPEALLEQEGGYPVDIFRLHPFDDAYWEEKRPKLEEITLPMLVCGSFSDHGLHTVGSCRAFRKAKSEHKWLYTHRTGKWDAYYDPEVQQLTKDFFDTFLKDERDSGFLERAPVRLEVRRSREEIHAVRDEQEWPLARTEYTPLYLDLAAGVLRTQEQEQAGELVYSAKGGKASFRYTFAQDTELTGCMKLKLWVEVRPGRAGGTQPDDMVICAAVDKRDRHGRPVRFLGSVGNTEDMVTRGFLRVSRRELDVKESTPWEPVYTLRSSQPLSAGERVPVEIALCPSSTFFAAGESLELVIAADEIIPSPPYKKDLSCNQGLHVFHSGGTYDAHLLIPRIPGAQAGSASASQEST